MEARKEELIQGFLVAYQKRCCANFGGKAKMIAFYHHKAIDMLKLGCTLPKLANICPHKATDKKFYPFTEGDKDLFG